MSLLVLSALLLHGSAQATEYTDMPERLSGTVAVRYLGFGEWGTLVEGDEEIAKRRVSRHDVDYVLEFAPLRGFAGVIDISHTPSVRFAYPEAREMLAEPVNGAGTYLLGGISDVDSTVAGSGLNGVWVGAALSPFSERYDTPQPSTWRLDLAFRSGSKTSNLWTTNASGNRGSAPGGTALRVGAAFSSVMGRGNPWMRVLFEKENKVEGVELRDAEGSLIGIIDIAPASTFEMRFGVEAIGTDDRETGNRFATDFFLGVGYRTWEDVASGIYLPNPLEAGREVPTTVGEQVFLVAGLAFDVHAGGVIKARTGPQFRFHTPFRPEHLYDVRTAPAHFGFGWSFDLQGIISAAE